MSKVWAYSTIFDEGGLGAHMTEAGMVTNKDLVIEAFCIREPSGGERESCFEHLQYGSQETPPHTRTYTHTYITYTYTYKYTYTYTQSILGFLPPSVSKSLCASAHAN